MSRTYANKPRNRVSRGDTTAKIQSFSSETRFLCSPNENETDRPSPRCSDCRMLLAT